jgi:hypothetical protein
MPRLPVSTTLEMPLLLEVFSSHPRNSTTTSTLALLLWKPNTRKIVLPLTSPQDNGEPHGSLLTLLTLTPALQMINTTGLNSISQTVLWEVLPFLTGLFPESPLKPLSTSTTVSSCTSLALVLKELPLSLPGRLQT